MKAATSALLLGASTAFAHQDQHVLGGEQAPAFDFHPHINVDSAAAESIVDAVKKPWEIIEKALGEVPTQAKDLWSEMSLLVPGFMDKAANLISQPKPHTRRPDSHWDRIVKGADIESMWVETDGVKHRKLEGNLESYNLRAKKVDPSVLGVDDVKQYSGYLDDEANDKHLFYCKFCLSRLSSSFAYFILTQYSQGSSSLATTPRTTPLCFGSTVALDAHP